MSIMLRYLSLPIGLMLVLSAWFVSYDPVASAAPQRATILTIDDVPSKVRPGDQVTFTGTLTNAEGAPLSEYSVNIILLTSEPKLIVAATGVTGEEGDYEIIWDVELVPTYKPEYDVTRSVNTQVMSLFAQFDGTERLAPSKTAKSTITIEVNSILTFVNVDKKLYREGESATIFIGFVDLDDEFVDPDWINAHFNLEPIGDELEKKKVGSYTYVTPPLEKGDNQISVIPVREGFNMETEHVTITVLPEGSMGRLT